MLSQLRGPSLDVPKIRYPIRHISRISYIKEMQITHNGLRGLLASTVTTSRNAMTKRRSTIGGSARWGQAQYLTLLSLHFKLQTSKRPRTPNGTCCYIASS